MAALDPGECEVCLQSFDEDDRRPRVLPCGHTFCTACIVLVITQGDLQCSTCRVQHRFSSVKDIPINYYVEQMVHIWKREQSPPIQDVPNVNRRSLMSIQEDVLTDLEKQQRQCQELNDELDQYDLQLLAWRHENQQLTTGLSELLQHNETTDRQIVAECQVVADLQKEAETKIQRIKDHQEQLTSATRVAQLTAVIEDVNNCMYDTRRWLHLNLPSVPNSEVVSTCLKVRNVTRKAVQVADHMMKTYDPEYRALTHAEGGNLSWPSRIMDKIKLCEEITLAFSTAVTLTTTNDLKESLKTGSTIQRLEASETVVAGVRLEGGCRYAKITLTGGRVHFHCLEDQATLNQFKQFHTLLQEDVASNVDKWASVAFLDLCWGGATRGRLYIRLLPNNILAQQFLLLCWGSRGVNYRGTKLLEVWDKGRPMERVLGGDYEQNNGEGGASLLQRLDDDAYQWWPSTAGLVESRIRAGKNKSSQFVIATKDYSNLFFSAPLGNVEQGLEVLREAVSLRDITEVTVSDCGVVVDL